MKCMPVWPLVPLLLVVLGENSDADSEENCFQLIPSTAAVNHRRISQCLRLEQRVTLGPGIFLLPHGLKMPPNSTLQGALAVGSQKTSLNASLASRLLLAVPTAITHPLLEVSSDSLVSSVILDAGGKQRDATCCTSVISFIGNNSVISDVEALGSPAGIGVLFESPTSRDNLVFKMHVHRCYYGIVFAHGLRSQVNTVEQSTIEDIHCDAISFAGFGQVRRSVIRNSGFACGPPAFGAGAGFFCKGNRYGAQIEDSIVSNTCGMSLDVDSCSHLEVRNNSFSNTGYDWDRNLTHCWGMPTAILLDSQMCSINYNSMENSRPSNRIRWSGDPHQVYGQVAAPLFSDLPEDNDTILNFALLHRPNAMALPSIQNDVSNNSFFSRCDENNCTGLAYFAGRGTGLESQRTPGHHWGERLPKQPSEFNGNVVSDSDVGSVRCGENWYAAAQPVCPEESDWPCNLDDYLHPDQNFRNDDCRDYISPTHQRFPPGNGELRNPLPLAPREDVSMYRRLRDFAAWTPTSVSSPSTSAPSPFEPLSA